MTLPWTATGSVIVTGTSSGDFATIKYSSGGVQQWVARYAGPGDGEEYGPYLAVDGNDNVYVAGSSAPAASNDYDYAMVKYNTAGEQQWVQTYDSGENGRDIAVAVAVYTDSVDQTAYVVVTGESETPGTLKDLATVMVNESGIEAWSARYDGTGSSDSQATDMAVDSAGNVYVTGYTDTSLDNTNFLTAKYSSDGLELWTRQYNSIPGSDTTDQAEGVVVDADGNVYVTGRIDVSPYDDCLTVKYDTDGNQLAEIVFDSGHNDRPVGIALFVDSDDGSTYLYVASTVAVNSSGSQYAVIKYDADLVEQWVRTYSYIDGREARLSALAVDSDGNAYLTGASETVAGYDAYATVKFDKSGDEIWDAGHNLDTLDDEAKALAVDTDGNVYVTGKALYRTEFVNNQYLFSSDCITVKYDVDGNEVWVARYDANGYGETCSGIAVDGQGNVHVVGTGQSSAQYDPDYVVLKYDAAGQELWAVTWDGGINYADYMHAIALDSLGHVYVTGQSATGGGDNSDYATIRYDSDGNLLWLQRYNDFETGAVGLRTYPTALVVKDDGHVYVTGQSKGADTGADFGTVKYSQETVITDTDAPLVEAINPADQAIDILVTAIVTATFNEAMNGTAIETPSVFTVAETVSGTAVGGTVLYDENDLAARFSPTADLSFGTQYTARISTGAMDLAGNPMAQDRVWQFTTLSEPDITAPLVEGTTPADNATGVTVNALINATFSEPMEGDTISTASFTLVDDASGSEVAGTVGYDTGTWIARFDLESSLAFDTAYTATLTTNVTDVAGNELAEARVWRFTTGSAADITAPFVISMSPADAATDIAVTLGTVTATFNEPMVGSMFTTETFTLVNDTTGAAVTGGTVTYDAGTARLSIGSALAFNTEYEVTIAANVTDIAGNSLAEDLVWTFKTLSAPPPQDSIPPRAVSTSPSASPVPASIEAITVTFSEPIQGIDTTSFKVSASGNEVPGTVQYDAAAMTAWFYPTTDLAFNTQYTVTIISILISDLADNGMEQDYIWFFTTGGDPALAGCNPEIGQEEGCVNFDYFTYGTGVEVNTYGSSIAGFTAEEAARRSVSFEEPLSEDLDDSTGSYESQAVARVDNTDFSLRSRSKRIESTSDRAGAWSIGASKINVTGVPPGTAIPMSIVVSGNFTAPSGTLLLQVRDFDDYRMLGTASVLNSGRPIYVLWQAL